MEPSPMDRREALRKMGAGLLAAPAVLRGRYRLFRGSGQEYSARAVRLVQESTVVDMLNQFRFPDFAEEPPSVARWLRDPSSFTEETWREYRDSGFDVIALGHARDDYESAVDWFAEWNGFLASNAHRFQRVDSGDDFERVRGEGTVGVMLTFQNSAHFRSEDDVDRFHGLGQRVSQLTYNYQNRIGSGFLEENDHGLTVFGASVVERMNEVGMAVDLSHCNDRTTLDALEATEKPALFTHATCRALVPGALRCKTDEAIRALARGGGVMGVAFLRFMIRDREPTELEHVLDHFDHVTRLVGPEHLGVGSDMDLVGNPHPPNAPEDRLDPENWPPNFERYRIHADEEGRITIEGLDHPKRTFDLTEGLVRRGYSDADIRGILGGNFVRALGEIW